MADAVTMKLVAFVLKMTSIDPYVAAGDEYVNRHTREYFDMGLATTVLDAMNVTCAGYHSGPTYQAYL
ncbi:hypothetical protein [Agrobacterium tumefaciens]|uniref:Uncharacterized protein n=1 Tax=Agrobacterium tumefaciens TaxID=358 RepID=A0A4D7YWC3_AGRTU|nr:hypothetical protein [Agrobacterium tumefaciens]QCL96082.1 hypothetical protein CFBP7129_17620 [Agrobacterium tumefaciens]